jgi:arabinogalactan oligomer/maltooligosaccharide transport system permease protein
MTATAQAAPKRRSKLRHFFVSGREDSLFKRIVIHLVLIGCCVIAVYPVLRVLTVSLRPGDRLLSTSLAIIPDDATLEAYRTVLVDKDFLLWLWNSIAITAGTAVVGVTLAATSAYAFSRWRFPGRGAGMVFLLATQMIPAPMMIVPIFILATKLALTETYRGLVIAYSVTSVPFSIWILKGYYDTIPLDLEEAALIDGASRMGAFWRIILPLSAPALAIVFLFNFMTAWNDYLFARVMLGKAESLWTWPLGLQRFQSQFQTQWGMFAAASIMVTIPVLILFLYSSKWLISGLTLGSVKG